MPDKGPLRLGFLRCKMGIAHEESVRWSGSHHRPGAVWGSDPSVRTAWSPSLVSKCNLDSLVFTVFFNFWLSKCDILTLGILTSLWSQVLCLPYRECLFGEMNTYPLVLNPLPSVTARNKRLRIKQAIAKTAHSNISVEGKSVERSIITGILEKPQKHPAKS